MTDIALRMADATKESEVRKASRRYLMLKAVLVKPVRGGGGRRNRNINQTEKLMTSFYKGHEDEVWKTSLDIESCRKKQREKQRKTRRKENLKRGITGGINPKDEVKRRSD